MTSDPQYNMTPQGSRKFDLDGLVRPNILTLSPYHAARDDFDEGVLLDANENGLGAPFEDDNQLNRYPDPHQKILRQKIAEFRGIKADQVFVGVGSDEAIDLLIRIFCRPGQDNIIITPPTYGMYEVSAAINDIEVKRATLTPGFELDPVAILEITDKNSKLLFLCSPNNPTANLMDEKTICGLLDQFPGLVVVDEAYIDFSGTPGFSSRLADYPNLVVIQTFSKSFGLAGARLGLALAPEPVISWMMKVKAPYNINRLTASAALKAFDHLTETRNHVDLILKERDRVADALQKTPGVEHVFPSNTNFLLVRIREGLNIYRKLIETGIIVRYRGNEPHCEDCLRITIGSPEENDLLLNTLVKLTR